MPDIDFGSALTLVGLAVTWLLYQLQLAGESRDRIDTAVSLLGAVESGLTGPDGWGRVFFGNAWIGDELEQRAQKDFDAVMLGGEILVHEVPTEPLAALVASPLAGDLISRDTVASANMALFKLRAFNQLVRQQTELYTRHLAEIADEQLLPARRRSIASALRAQSRLLHGDGIGAANARGAWFDVLTSAITANVEALRERRRRTPLLGVPAATVFVLVTALIAVLAID